MTWQIRCCAECGHEIKPVGLFFDSTPGWRCHCQWGTLTKLEFKQMFGKAFSEMYSVPNKNSWWAHSVALKGNAKDRRKARRAGLGVKTSF